MGGIELRFERELEFPRAIVWDALVDDELVSGWLGEATIVAEEDGQYRMRWMQRPGQPELNGRITVFQPPERLQVETATDSIRFGLEEVPGGNRGTSTRLLVAVRLVRPQAPIPSLKADWLTSLDQLRDLLFGHPVHWPDWEREMRRTWSQHQAKAGNSSA